MDSAAPRRNPVEKLADEFLQRYRAGEDPPLTEYAERYPELADEIRELFPALVMLEQARPRPRAATVSESHMDRLGDYQILREVGRGGMGIVYEAEQESLGRHVALKVLPTHLASDATALQRFRREARSAARLHHTNIVPVFDVGECEGTHYYAMQFIRGQGLDEVLRELKRLRDERERAQAPTRVQAPERHGPLTASLAHGLLTGQLVAEQAAAGGNIGFPGAPEMSVGNAANPHAHSPARTVGEIGSAAPSQSQGSASSAILKNSSEFSSHGDSHYYRSVAHLGLQVAEALAYAHSQRIWHRDIKPSNLLLDNQGIVWVTDFGLAKEEGDDLTRSGDLVGTLRYMAPERFNGQGDARSDLYSLALTLYEMLTLRPAFDESDRALLVKRVTHEEPLRPRRVDPRVPRDLETIVLKGMAKEPGRRYAAAHEMAEDFRRFLADRPIRARRSGIWEHAWRWCRRNPLPAGLSAVVLILLVVAGVALPLTVMLRTERDRARSAEQRATKAEGQFEFTSYLAQAAAYRHSGQAGQRFKGLQEIKKALQVAHKLQLSPGEVLQIRNEAIACLCLPDFELASVGEGGWPSGSSGFALDPSFGVYARGDLTGQVVVCRVATGQVLYRFSVGYPVSGYDGCEFSRDGGLLHVVCGPPTHASLWKLPRGSTKAVQILCDDHCSFAFRPDGIQYALGYRDGTIRVYDSQSNHELRRYNAPWEKGNPGLAWNRCLWNPAYPRLLSGYRADWWLLDFQTGKSSRLPLPADKTYGALAWHPQGKLLALSASDGKVYLWDTVRCQLALPPLQGHNSSGLLGCFNHAGDRLLTTDWSGLWRLWDTRTCQQLLTLPAGGTHVQFSADDELVAADLTFPRLGLLRFRSGREFRTANAPGSRTGYVARGPGTLDPTGRWYLAPTGADEMVFLDMETGDIGAKLPGYASLGFAEDGSLWTYGKEGVLRWPCRVETQANRCRLGPPQCIFQTAEWNQHDRSADGRILAVPRLEGGAVLMHVDTGRAYRLGPQHDVRYCAVSPDGRWVATGTHSDIDGSLGANVWDARTGRLVKALPVEVLCAVQFSPDGKWLLTTGGGPRLWKVGTWQEGPALGGTKYNTNAVFAPDSALLALGDAPGVVRLVIPTTGMEVARLTAPVKSRLVPRCFSKDQARLICIGSETRAVYIFDLHAIRTQLAALGLDWNPVSIPAATSAEPPRRFEIVPADVGTARYWQRQVAIESVLLALNPYNVQAVMRRGTAYFRLRQPALAAKDYARALPFLDTSVKRASLHAFIPASALNASAWQWAKQPGQKDRGQIALTFARMAVAAAPESYLNRNTLGVTCYRLGEYKEAQKHLEQSLRAGGDEASAFDLFFLAMCYQHLGHAAQARGCYARACRWAREHRGKFSTSWAAELNQFQIEAAAVLGVGTESVNEGEK